MRLAALALAATLTSSIVASAGTSDPIVTLTWTAPPGNCPDVDYVRERVRAHLGVAVADAPDHPIAAEGRVERVAAGFELTLTTVADDGTKGVRTLRAASCRAIADGAALVLAMAVNPARVAAATAEPDTIAPAPAPLETPLESTPLETTTPRVAERPAASPSAREPTPRAHATVSALGLVDAGLLPKASPGVGLAIGLHRAPLHFELWAATFATQRTTLDDRAAGAELSAIVVGSRGNVALLHSPLATIGPSVGFELARVGARGVAVSSPMEGSSTRPAVTVGIDGRVWLGRIALRGSLDWVVGLRRSEFYLEQLGTVHSTATSGARFAVGLDVRF